MSPKPVVALAQIVEHVRRVYGIDAREVGLAAGADAGVTVYRIGSDQGAYFLKLRAEQPESAPLARWLADAGLTAVVAPVRPREEHLSTRIGGLTATIYPFVEGENGFHRPLNEDQWTALGAVVRAVHDFMLPRNVGESMRRETYSYASRAKVLAYLAAVPPQSLNDAVARELIALLRTRELEIAALVEHAEQLAASLQQRVLPQVPSHGDLHAGNILIDRAGSLFIVDWDDAALAPKERDLMFVGGGVGGVWNRPHESAAFYRGYGPASVDAESLAFYRCQRVVEDVAVFCDQLLLEGGDQGAEREESLQKLMAAFNPNDVVEIAERTFAAL
ncbi:MAG: aminoglycoside phosphotransferase family protein [Dehalococcoidia bacterium]